MKLLIVETLKEVDKIRPFLESEEPGKWIVKASFNLVCKLAPLRIKHPGEKTLRHFNISGEYHDTALYENDEGQKEALVGIQRQARNATDGVYLATRLGLKGEGLAWHLQRILEIKSPKRVILYENNSTVIKAALAKSRAVNVQLVKAYEEHRSGPTRLNNPARFDKWNRCTVKLPWAVAAS